MTDRRTDGLRAEAERPAAWLRRTDGEQRLPVVAVLAAAMVLQALQPHDVQLVPRWLVLGPELLLSVVLVAANPVRLERDTTPLRVASLVLTGLVVAANSASAVLLVRALVVGGSRLSDDPGRLLSGGVLVYGTNVAAFALLYWELDRGGSVARAEGRSRHPDLLFPQMTAGDLAPPDWEPTILDYLYVSLTNATAFSPTDTMPMARWAKLLMAVQAAVALALVGLVIARAVNVLR